MSEGVIHVQQSFTVEEYIADNDNPNVATLFGDASRFYQATISATSRFARDLVSATTTTLIDNTIDEIPTPARNKKWITTALLLALINFVCTMADTMLALMLPEIMYDLNIEGFQWTLAGSAIGAAATTLSAGQLYGVYPLKQVYALFATLVLIGTISPAVAPNMMFIFYARILQGVGLAGIQLGAMIFLDHEGTFTDKSRRDFFILLSQAFGFMFGPFFGSVFAKRNRAWNWAFYAFFITLALIMAPLLYLLPSRLKLSTAVSTWSTNGSLIPWQSSMPRVDGIGCALSFTGILVLLISLNLAGTWTTWSNTYIYIPISIGVLLLLLLFIQQATIRESNSPRRLFPSGHLRQFKSTVLFLLTACVYGILQTTLPYAALYQLLSGGKGKALDVATYLLFSLTGPHLIPILVVPVYVGSGLVTSYPLLPSHSIWSFLTSIFLIAGTSLLFINTPSFFSPHSGLPSIVQQFALACIGWWSAVTLPLAHQIMDVLQPVNVSQQHFRHPYHNRSFILFASHLGAAITLTTTGSIFMTLGPRWTLRQLYKDIAENPTSYHEVTHPNRDDALVALLGYTFIRNGTSATLFEATIDAIQDTFGWSVIVILVLATLTFILSVALLIHKIWNSDLDWRNRVVGNVPREWRVETRAAPAAPGPNEAFENGPGPAVELQEDVSHANWRHTHGGSTLVDETERERVMNETGGVSRTRD